MPEERKLVTVLFADVVGSTALGVERDAEVVRATLSRAFAAAREALEAHGGTVEKFIGDAIVAVFGVPLAHDDDADRAVRAALALRERIANLHARVPIEIRIGINSGEAVTGSGEGAQFMVTGTPVNAAARIQQAAQPGEVLVGAVTRRLTDRGVRFGPSRVIDAKGLGRLEVWPALELATAVPEQHRGIEMLRAPLIGRDRELRLLEDAFARVRDERAPALVTVYGPPGAGKSRLTSELVSRIGTDRVRVGRCLPYGQGITFYAVQLIVRADAGITLTDDHKTALDKLERAAAEAFGGTNDDVRGVVARVATLAGLVEAGEALPAIAPSEIPEELRFGLRRYLERRADAAPLALVFEDVHWAEPGLLDLIEHLAEWSRAPLLILCLARPDFRDLRPGFGASAPNASAVTLTPLDADETRRLVSELLSFDALPDALRAEVVTRADGNPLYVEEFLRMLIDDGRIARRDGEWVATSDLTRLDVPPTLTGLITARLDRVSPGVKRILQTASIVGRLFSTSGLAAIGGERATPEDLREAVRRDLLVEADESALGEGRVYRFKHVLIRDVAYSTLPKGERSRLHGNYARWLEASLGDRKDEIADIIAFHAEQAHLLARELDDPDAAALGRWALDWLLLAGRRAVRRGDFRAATGVYARAIDIADAIDASLAERAEAYGYVALYEYNERTDAGRGAILERALDIAERAGPSEILVRLLEAHAIALVDGGNAVAARALFERLVPVAEATGDLEVVGDAMVQRAFGAYYLGDPDHVARREAAAAFFERTGARRSYPRVLSELAVARAYTGNFTEAVRLLDLAAATLRDRGGFRFGEVTNLFWRAGFAWFWGDADLGIELSRKGLELARDAGLTSRMALLNWTLGDALIAKGEYVAASGVLAEAATLFEAQGRRGQIPEARARLAICAARLGDRDAARAHLAVASEALIPSDREAGEIVRLARAELAIVDGDPEAAEREYRAALQELAGLSFAYKIVEVRLAYGRFLLSRGRAAEAKRELSLARDYFADPLAAPRRAEIDALLARAEVRAT